MNSELNKSNWFWKRSAGGLTLYYPLKKAIDRYVNGTVLDVGAGFMPYKKFILKKTNKYYSTDFTRTHPDLNYVGDIVTLTKTVKGKQFDTIFCTEVFEHLPDPFRAANEIYKTLKKNGTLIISVPFIMPLHNEPYDFYRYTKHGLKKVFEKFTIVELEGSGGILSLLHYLLSSFLVPLVYPLKPLFYIVVYCNWLTGELCYRIDNKLFRKIIPFKYILVCKK